MNQRALNDEEHACLAAFARDEQDVDAAEEVLARLEEMGLLMRGWGRTFVVTQLGFDLLGQRRSVS
jgi:hypothetical protein